MTWQPKRESAGFTMMEFIVVVAITGILIVGLGAVVEIPRQVAEQELAGDARISDVDRAVRWLDEDVRFAKDVAVPSVGELHVTRRDGRLVKYTWGGSSGPLVRTAPEGTANLISSAARVAFSLGMTEMAGTYLDGSMDESVVEAAAFESFSLADGWFLSDLLPIGSLLRSVDLLVGTLPIESGKRVGLSFTASGLDADGGFIESIRLRLRRNGSGGIYVAVWSATDDLRSPDWLHWITGKWVENSALPASMSDFEITMPENNRIHDGRKYFVEIYSQPLEQAAVLETRALSLAAAASPTGGGVLRSILGGPYDPIAGSLAASQTVFSVKVKSPESVASGSSGDSQLIPTCVQATLQIVTADGVRSIDTSVPIENNVARVTR